MSEALAKEVYDALHRLWNMTSGLDNQAADAINALDAITVEVNRLRIAAQALLAQIEAGTFKDELGHDLKRNVHYIALRDLLKGESKS